MLYGDRNFLFAKIFDKLFFCLFLFFAEASASLQPSCLLIGAADLTRSIADWCGASPAEDS